MLHSPAHLISYPVLPSPKETLYAVTYPVNISAVITINNSDKWEIKKSSEDIQIRKWENICGYI